LDFIKYESNLKTTRLFHPIIDNEGFLILKYVPDINHDTQVELIVIDANNLKKLVVLNRVFGIDFTADNKLILGTGPFYQQCKRFIF